MTKEEDRYLTIGIKNKSHYIIIVNSKEEIISTSRVNKTVFNALADFLEILKNKYENK